VERLVAALASAYGLAVERAERIDFGIWEESFSVWTDRGRVFAKRFLRKDRKDEVMLRGLHLSERLRGAGFPAPRIAPARASGDLVATVDGERYQVTEWVEGVCYHPGEMPARCVAPMGALLGRFHRLVGGERPALAGGFNSPGAAASQCRALLERYRQSPAEPFSGVAAAVLEEQIGLLEALPLDYADRLPLPQLGGACFNSFWSEQILFRPDGEVAALVDWTDGAGKPGFWADDLDTGIHLSALGLPAIGAFVAGYQSENPLPEGEWRALAASLCYEHLASVNFLYGWFQRPYRRMADWEATAERWHRLVPVRFRQYGAIEEAMLEAVR